MALRPVRSGAATPSRHPGAGVQPVYEDFRPISDWQQDEESNILLIFLPGFMKQHLKVSTEDKNIVRVRGERLVAGNKWNRFLEDYQVPENCNIRAVRARFEDGILTITMPWKKDSQAQDRSQEAAKATPPTPVIQKREDSPQKPPTEPRPQKGADDIPSKTISPADIQKLPLSPRKPTMEPSRQKGADDISPKIISTPDTQKREMSPPKESRPQKGADDIPPKGLTQPSITAGIGNDEKMFGQPTQIGQGEQRVGIRSHEPKTATQVTSDKKGVERKEISTDTKAKPTKSENMDKLKEGTDDKISVEKSKAAVPDPAENVANSIGTEKGKSEKIQKGSEYTGQRERLTKTTIASSSIDYGLGNSKKAAKSLSELNEERQLLVNIGVAVLVIMALGAYISYTVRSGEN